ncbi:MAG: hypothetical protein ACD_19C00176G0060 [uncultured bacterium]|nr:MAG: hypothetical protein ACD_19C00176G0060 [uncultured bacterium]
MKKGFTLIELLVVVSLIGILATLVIANMNAARERARDATRKSDLRNIQTALRLYYNDNGGYPITSALPAWGSAWTPYMNILPADPLSSQGYSYNSVAGSDDYTLYACLENVSDDKCIDVASSVCTSLCKYEVKP